MRWRWKLLGGLLGALWWWGLIWRLTPLLLLPPAPSLFERNWCQWSQFRPALLGGIGSSAGQVRGSVGLHGGRVTWEHDGDISAACGLDRLGGKLRAMKCCAMFDSGGGGTALLQVLGSGPGEESPTRGSTEDSVREGEALRESSGVGVGVCVDMEEVDKGVVSAWMSRKWRRGGVCVEEQEVKHLWASSCHVPTRAFVFWEERFIRWPDILGCWPRSKGLARSWTMT